MLGCASAGSHARADGGSGNTLTSEQLTATNAEKVFDAITKLRPSWLTTRGPTSVTDATPTGVSIFMGGTFLGKADYLQQVRVADVAQAKYWEPGSASARFGMGHPRGV